MHMVREKEKEASRMTPRFRACNVVWLVLFTEFRSTERTRCGEKNRAPLCSTGCPAELYNTGVLERTTGSVSDKLSLRCL